MSCKADCMYTADGEYKCPSKVKPESFGNTKFCKCKNKSIEKFSNEYAFMSTLPCSGGNDIMQDGANANNIDALKATCDNLPNCMSFNSNGWMKTSLTPKNNWNAQEPSFMDNPNIKGCYVKIQASDPSYTFLPGVAGPGGYDVLDNRQDANNIDNLKATCNIDPSCQGFNTNGWMKGNLPNRDSWANTQEPSFQDNPDMKGFYIKN